MWKRKIGEVVIPGTKFNSWTVIEEVPLEIRKDKRERQFRVKCDCGFEDVVNYKNLKYGKSKACKRCRTKSAITAWMKHWEPIEKDDYYLIPLSSGKFAIIDKDDLDKVINTNWCYSSGYAMSTSNGKRPMHRVINNTPDGMCTDHINGDKLDNRKCNLRSISRIDHIKHHHEYIRSFQKDHIKGERVKTSKLKECDVVEILKMLKNGVCGCEIAKIYNVSPSTISCIRKRKSWKHIDREI